ncbi:MAG TPA: LD-carboxypeptidase [Anaerolineales bacterium]|nr:LD-carboxypeptidase [Anaerolineales bacterium]
MLQKAKRLKPGDKIGVVSPSSPTYRKSDVLRATEKLKELGYQVAIGKNVNNQKGLVSATEEERVADLHEMFARDDVDAIFVTQGGYGSAQIVGKLDYDLVRKHPKIFIGFSDITMLHLAIGKLAGLVTFHGPGMCRFNDEDLSDYTHQQMLKALGSEAPLGLIPMADPKKWLFSLDGGVCEGEIIGGNMTIVCASLGTPYEIETAGKILFLEDIDVEPWIFDHMLCHLRNAGKLKDVRGVVISECVNCVPYDYKPGYYIDLSVEDVLNYYLKPLGIPVLYGHPLGHTKDMATIPLGVRARLDGDKKELTILESGVID